MISLLRKMSRIVTDMHYDTLPERVVSKAKLCIADALACSLAGYDLPWSQIAMDWAKKTVSSGNSMVWCGNQKLTACDASLVNGIIAHSTLQEDMHIGTYSHPGSIIVPSAFAVADEVEVSGKELITAIVAGYEAMLRLGVLLHTPEFESTSFRPSGFFGPYGAAASAGVLKKLTEQQMVNALSLAGNTGIGYRQFGIEGTMDVYFHNGIAARNGILSTQLAELGYTSSEYLLEGSGGIAPCFKVDETRESINRPNCDTWEIDTVYFKPVAGCSAVQTVAQLALDMAIQFDIEPKSIENVIIRTHMHGKNNPGTDYCGPFQKLNQAQMSNQFAVSVALIKRDISFLAYKDFQNKEVMQLAAKCKVVVDDAIEKVYPKNKSAGIEIVFKDGDRLKRYKQDLQYPKEDEIFGKLKNMAISVYNKEYAEKLVTTIRNIESLDDIRMLSKQIGRGGDIYNV